MRILENTFVILHIKIAHIKILKMSARTLVTLGLILFILFGIMQMYIAWQSEPVDFWGIVQSLTFTFILSYMAMFWLKSWGPANKMLNKALDLEHKHENNQKEDK